MPRATRSSWAEGPLGDRSGGWQGPGEHPDTWKPTWAVLRHLFIEAELELKSVTHSLMVCDGWTSEEMNNLRLSQKAMPSSKWGFSNGRGAFQRIYELCLTSSQYEKENSLSNLRQWIYGSSLLDQSHCHQNALLIITISFLRFKEDFSLHISSNCLHLWNQSMHAVLSL